MMLRRNAPTSPALRLWRQPTIEAGIADFELLLESVFSAEFVDNDLGRCGHDP